MRDPSIPWQVPQVQMVEMITEVPKPEPGAPRSSQGGDRSVRGPLCAHRCPCQVSLGRNTMGFTGLDWFIFCQGYPGMRPQERRVTDPNQGFQSMKSPWKRPGGTPTISHKRGFLLDRSHSTQEGQHRSWRCGVKQNAHVGNESPSAKPDARLEESAKWIWDVARTAS